MNLPILTNTSFAENEFGNISLNDKRLSARLIKVVMGMNASPDLSLPSIFTDKKELKGLYRLFQNVKVDDQSVLQKHYENTIRRCEECSNEILLVTDTVYIEPSKYKMFEGLQIKSKSRDEENKVLVHYMIAVDPKSYTVLGITDLILFQGNCVQGEIVDNQSQKWIICVENTVRRVKQFSNKESTISKFIYIADRESDDIAVFHKAEELNINFIIRGRYDRSTNDELFSKISELAGQEKKEGDPYKIEVIEKGSKRTALVQRYSYPSFIPISHHKNKTKLKDSSLDEVQINMVTVSEITPPKGCQRAHWLLFTSLEAHGTKNSEKVVNYYKKRWIIEELNKCAKTGVKLEDRQFTKFEHFAPFIAITFVIAWRILTMRTISDIEGNERIENYFLDEEYDFLRKNLEKREVELIVSEAIKFIAELGGFLNTYERPGWIVLWRGWTKFSLMSYGYGFYKKNNTS